MYFSCFVFCCAGFCRWFVFCCLLLRCLSCCFPFVSPVVRGYLFLVQQTVSWLQPCTKSCKGICSTTLEIQMHPGSPTWNLPRHQFWRHQYLPSLGNVCFRDRQIGLVTEGILDSPLLCVLEPSNNLRNGDCPNIPGEFLVFRVKQKLFPPTFWVNELF